MIIDIAVGAAKSPLRALSDLHLTDVNSGGPTVLILVTVMVCPQALKFETLQKVYKLQTISKIPGIDYPKKKELIPGIISGY